MKNANGFGRATQRNAHRDEAPAPTSELLPKAKDDRVILGFRISEDKRRAFRTKATQEDTTVQAVLTEAVDRFLAE